MSGSTPTPIAKTKPAQARIRRNRRVGVSKKSFALQYRRGAAMHIYRGRECIHTERQVTRFPEASGACAGILVTRHHLGERGRGLRSLRHVFFPESRTDSRQFYSERANLDVPAEGCDPEVTVKAPRIGIAWLMVAVAIIGFHLAIICPDAPVFGLHGLEVGLLPGLTVLTITIFSMSGTRGGPRPLAWGFAGTLAVAICLYVVCCLTVPDLVRRPISYYVNEIEPFLYDADLTVTYRLSWEIIGLIVGLPQLALALIGGFLSRSLWTTIHRR